MSVEIIDPTTGNPYPIDGMRSVEDIQNIALNAVSPILAPIESTSTASQAYAIGDQFIYNGLLTEATSAIAQGATITVGSSGNAKLADCIADQLTALNSNLSNKADKEWSAIEATMGSIEKSLPSNKSEFLFKVNINNIGAIITIYVPLICIPATGNQTFRGGYSNGGSATSFASVMLTNSTWKLVTCTLNGTDVLSTTPCALFAR